TYVDQAMHFSLAVPDGWLVDNSGRQGPRVIFFNPIPEDNFRANITVVVDSLSPLTPEEYFMLNRLQVKRLSGNSRLLLDEPAWAMEGAQIFEWTALQMGPIPLKFRQLGVVARGRGYAVTCTAPLHRFETYRGEFEATLDSFRMIEPQ